MPEKFESKSESSEEISEYMVERLKRESIEDGERQKQKRLSPEQFKEGVLQLADLTLEKEDLLQAIGATENALGAPESGKTKERIFSQDEIIDKLDSAAELNLRKLGRRFDANQNLGASIEENKKQLE